MSEAIKSIVSGYVRLKDRKALEILREHRQHALMSLKERSNGWFEVSRLIQQFDEDRDRPRIYSPIAHKMWTMPVNRKIHHTSFP